MSDSVRPRDAARRLAVSLTLLLIAAGCGAEAPPSKAERAPAGTTGILTVLTYNVAGLPQTLSGSNPATNISLISPRLNAFDVVLIQEDFAYHQELISAVRHPYRTHPSEDRITTMGDGLNQFSLLPFGPLDRRGWRWCHGLLSGSSDCLTTKGFSHSALEVTTGVRVDLYNHHQEAGNGPADQRARTGNVEQFLAYLDRTSADRAVIFGGDTNLHPNRPGQGDLLEQMRAEGDLTDACLELDCPDPNRIDRIYYRSGPGIEIEALDWFIPEGFTDDDGAPLSDHLPVAARLRWTVR